MSADPLGSPPPLAARLHFSLQLPGWCDVVGVKKQHNDAGRVGLFRDETPLTRPFFRFMRHHSLHRSPFLTFPLRFTRHHSLDLSPFLSLSLGEGINPKPSSRAQHNLRRQPCAHPAPHCNRRPRFHARPFVGGFKSQFPNIFQETGALLGRKLINAHQWLQERT